MAGGAPHTVLVDPVTGADRMATGSASNAGCGSSGVDNSSLPKVLMRSLHRCRKVGMSQRRRARGVSLRLDKRAAGHRDGQRWALHEHALILLLALCDTTGSKSIQYVRLGADEVAAQWWQEGGVRRRTQPWRASMKGAIPPVRHSGGLCAAYGHNIGAKGKHSAAGKTMGEW